MFKAAIYVAERFKITAGRQPIGWRVIVTDGDVLTALEQTCIGFSVVSDSATDPDLSD
jgi:hypothetical protein